MPCAIVGPMPSMLPPGWFLTSFTVSYVCAVLLNSQRILPVLESYARIQPSTVPENTAPGITAGAADCARTHSPSARSLERSPAYLHGAIGAGTCQAIFPVAGSMAERLGLGGSSLIKMRCAPSFLRTSSTNNAV